MRFAASFRSHPLALRSRRSAPGIKTHGMFHPYYRNSSTYVRRASEISRFSLFVGDLSGTSRRDAATRPARNGHCPENVADKAETNRTEPPIKSAALRVVRNLSS